MVDYCVGLLVLGVLVLWLALRHPVPVPMVLDCPKCKARHLDLGEWAPDPTQNRFRPVPYFTVGVDGLSAAAHTVSAQEPPFKVGEVVRVAPNGPPMTVEEVHAHLDALRCCWFDGDRVLHQGLFSVDDLELALPSHVLGDAAGDWGGLCVVCGAEPREAPRGCTGVECQR